MSSSKIRNAAGSAVTFLVGALVGPVLTVLTALFLMSMVPTPLPLVLLPLHWGVARWLGRGARWYAIALAVIAAFFGGSGAAWYVDGTAARHGANANGAFEIAVGIVFALVGAFGFERTTRAVTSSPRRPAAQR